MKAAGFLAASESTSASRLFGITMSESSHSSGGAGPSHRSVEIGVALFMALLAAIGIVGSLKVGIGWGAEGPKAGFFPFYISLIVLISCAVNLVSVLREFTGRELFAEWGQIRQVLSVVIPTTVYVFAVPVLGMYVSSGLLIGVFMKWLGRYSWPMVLAIAIGVPIATFILFERWFLVPLPKGPLEDWLGLVSVSDMIEDIGNLFHGFSVVLQPYNIMLMVLGIVLGVIIGVLPGLGGANGIAILLPLTFSMSPTSAIIMLSCIYWGALFGGAITSVLFNIPGEPWSVATTFDGYPMAQQGKAGEALTAAFTSSFVGALFAVIMITLLAPLVASFALEFGPPEIFSVYFLAFCSFVGMSKEPPFKTIASMMIGFALGAVGLDQMTGQLRLTFGFPELLSGFDFLIAVIGLFGIGEILLTMEEGLNFRGNTAQHQSEGGVADLEGAAALLGDLAALLPDRLLDGHFARRARRRPRS